LILAGRVYSGEQRIDKPGSQLRLDTPLAVREGAAYVSRGGRKLEGALDALLVDVNGLVCADLGASTGGFTDCLLKRGAKQVFAIDVGHGQLDERLRRDPRVVVMERTNARHLRADSLGGLVDLVVVDASFIGVDKLMPAVSRIAREGGRLLVLVKPQFEAGRDEARRAHGVIRDPAVREAAILRARNAVESHGFRILGEHDSVLRGPRGNLERFVLAERGFEPSDEPPP
jgi:23S rRNA (cytidine1920-2'-O)/16S rRNA (cytidine1409-2'-O)-methyltransferase